MRNHKVSVPFNRPWTRLNFRIEFDPAKGDASLDDMNQPEGRFHRMMKLVRSYRNGVLMFRVRPDGCIAQALAETGEIPHAPVV